MNNVNEGFLQEHLQLKTSGKNDLSTIFLHVRSGVPSQGTIKAPYFKFLPICVFVFMYLNVRHIVSEILEAVVQRAFQKYNTYTWSTVKPILSGEDTQMGGPYMHTVNIGPFHTFAK